MPKSACAGIVAPPPIDTQMFSVSAARANNEPTKPPLSWLTMYRMVLTIGMLPDMKMPNVTAGLKCPPL
jgi:hypothetical protein